MSEIPARYSLSLLGEMTRHMKLDGSIDSGDIVDYDGHSWLVTLSFRIGAREMLALFRIDGPTPYATVADLDQVVKERDAA